MALLGRRFAFLRRETWICQKGIVHLQCLIFDKGSSLHWTPTTPQSLPILGRMIFSRDRPLRFGWCWQLPRTRFSKLTGRASRWKYQLAITDHYLLFHISFDFSDWTATPITYFDHSYKNNRQFYNWHPHFFCFKSGIWKHRGNSDYQDTIKHNSNDHHDGRTPCSRRVHLPYLSFSDEGSCHE